MIKMYNICFNELSIFFLTFLHRNDAAYYAKDVIYHTTNYMYYEKSLGYSSVDFYVFITFYACCSLRTLYNYLVHGYYRINHDHHGHHLRVTVLDRFLQLDP